MRATTEEELSICFRIREEVFVNEQRIFAATDRDRRDEDPSTIHVIGLHGPLVCGAVRLYPLHEPQRWKGDRLAVLSAFRKLGLGAPLVRFAVRTASELGGEVMVAEIQVPNVGFFEGLGWYRVGEPHDYVGRAHQSMAIDLSQPPLK